MIGHLRGTLIDIAPPWLYIEAAGVGYELEAPISLFATLPSLGREVILHTHLLVREDAHLLYAFTSRREREVFRQLLRVSGVGPRLALLILSGLSIDELMHCLDKQDSRRLMRLPGIGRKTAERLLLELRDRLKPPPEQAVMTRPNDASSPAALDTAWHDAHEALIGLGYKAAEAERLLKQVVPAPDREKEAMTCEQWLRQALRLAMR